MSQHNDPKNKPTDRTNAPQGGFQKDKDKDSRLQQGGKATPGQAPGKGGQMPGNKQNINDPSLNKKGKGSY